MVSRLSKAPVIGSALAIVIATAGYGFSQNQTWDLPGQPVTHPTLEQMGPPAPVNLADVDEPDSMVPEAVVPETVSPGITAPEDMMAERMYADAADVARENVIYSYDRISGTGRSLEVPVRTIGSEATELADAAPAGSPDAASPVRVIDLPRRDDPTDAFGQPIEDEDTYQLAALDPSPEADMGSDAEELISTPVVPPVPAPAYRRPLSSYLSTSSTPSRQASTQLDPTVVDPVVTGNTPNVWSDGQVQYQTGPIRLDRVNSAQRVPQNVQARPNSLFMSDWVEVETGGYRRIVGR